MGRRVELQDLPPKYQAQALAQIQRQQQARKLARKVQQETAAPARNKYGAIPTEVNRIKFASKKEARRYLELMQLQELGIIEDLRLQRDYTLQEAYTTPQGERIRAIRYRADFTYKLTDVVPDDASPADREYFGSMGPGAEVIEDTKGCRTDLYKLKRKLAADRGYMIREV